MASCTFTIRREGSLEWDPFDLRLGILLSGYAGESLLDGRGYDRHMIHFRHGHQV